jgi:hypothetical protein
VNRVKGGAQLTCTLVTFAFAVPPPLAAVHVCAGLEGWVRMVTLYVLPAVTAVEKLKLPFPLIAKLSPPLFSNTKPVPVSPDTVPPIV